MERSQREDSPTGADLERKYIRIQTVGMSIFLAWPVAIVFVGTFQIKVDASILSVLMVMVAVLIFAIGYTARQELKEGGKGEWH